jgi:hypothetical protein
MLALSLLQIIISCLLSWRVSAAADSLQFLALGDWGKGGVNGDIRSTLTTYDESPPVEYQPDQISGQQAVSYDPKGGDKKAKTTYTYQVAIAGAMSRWITHRSPRTTEFILALGDNFYDYGVLSTSDTPWTTHWEKVYLQNYTNLRVPWFPVFGNHDYGYGQQGLEAQMMRGVTSDYTTNLWQFPNTNYSKVFPIPGGGAVGIVFVDTTTLAPSHNKCCNQNGCDAYPSLSCLVTPDLPFFLSLSLSLSVSLSLIEVSLSRSSRLEL